MCQQRTVSRGMSCRRPIWPPVRRTVVNGGSRSAGTSVLTGIPSTGCAVSQETIMATGSIVEGMMRHPFNARRRVWCLRLSIIAAAFEVITPTRPR